MPYKDLEQQKEYSRQYNREWMRQDREKDPEKYKQHNLNYRQNNPAQRLLSSTRQSAKLKNIEHSITKNDLHLPEFCPYLKVAIDYRAGVGKHMLNPSVDRIDSTKGYTKENIEVISNLANTMKCNATKEQLIEFAKTILVRNGYFVGKSSNIGC